MRGVEGEDGRGYICYMYIHVHVLMRDEKD